MCRIDNIFFLFLRYLSKISKKTVVINDFKKYSTVFFLFPFDIINFSYIKLIRKTRYCSLTTLLYCNFLPFYIEIRVYL